MARTQKICVAVTAALLMWNFLSGSALASGFFINTQGATPLGQGNAVVAHSEDPSSIYFNPALLPRINGTQIQIGTNVISPRTEFNSDFSGKDFKTKNDSFFPSTLYITHKVTDKFSVGLGIFSNFGLSTDWGDDWEGRYITTKADLTTYTVNPVVSIKLLPMVTLAGGVDILFLDADLRRNLNLSAFGLPDVKQTLKGDNVGLGFNVGLLVDVTDKVSVGLNYRSGIDINIQGDITHSIPSVLPPQLSALFPDTSGRTRLNLPAQASLGIAFKPIPELTVEVAGRWEGWSSFEEIRVKVQEPIAGNTELVLPRDWEDNYSFHIGGRYQVSKGIALLAGYIYEGNPIPNATFEPSVPDNGSNIYTAGIEIKHKQLSFALAYDYQRVRTRTKDNAIDDNPFDGVVNPATSANGRYKTTIHIVGASLTYGF